MRTLRKLAVSTAVAAMALVLSLASPVQVRAQSTDGLDEGKMLVSANCGRCHAVAEADASPHEAAPPFRTLSARFPMDALEEAFSDGRIYSGHPDMPEFIATPEQIEAIIAYIASLQE